MRKNISIRLSEEEEYYCKSNDAEGSVGRFIRSLIRSHKSNNPISVPANTVLHARTTTIVSCDPIPVSHRKTTTYTDDDMVRELE